MAKWLKIEDCGECPYYIGEGRARWCKKAQLQVSTLIKIPYWCPLPDAPAEDGNPWGMGKEEASCGTTA